MTTCNSNSVVFSILSCRTKLDTGILEQPDVSAAVDSSLVFKLWTSTSLWKKLRDVGPEVLFPRFTDVAALVRGFGILIEISKIFRKHRCVGDAKWMFNRVMSLDN